MPEFKWQRILVTTDLSAHSNQAVEYAHSLAEKFGAELHVLHVARNAKEAIAEHGATGTLEAGEQSDPHKQWLATLLGESGKVRRIEAVRIGEDPPSTILQYARDECIDLMVIATHGRTGLTHLLMGSVAESVLRHAPCPVLVMRLREPSKQ